MSLSEWLGFFITVVAVLFITIRQVFQDYKRAQQGHHEEEESIEQDRVLNDFLSSLSRDMKEGERLEAEAKRKENVQAPPKPKKQPQRQVTGTYQLTPKLEKTRTLTEIDRRELESQISDARIAARKDKIVSEELSDKTEDAYAIQEKVLPSRLHTLLHSIPKNNLLIFQQVIGRPKGLRLHVDSYEFHEFF
jgi:hypothetical protein